MMSSAPQQPLGRVAQPSRTGAAGLFAIAATVALVHLLTNNRYGFHRDELQFLSDARHLDWGFVAYPPLTPSLERISLEIFGLSMVGLRLFSVLAQSLAIFMTGQMTREFGGGRLAQVASALAVALSPLPLFEGTEFQYTTFDYLWWVLAVYFVVRLLKTDNPRWCLAVGATVGIGLMTKYTIAFLLAGILGGMLLTSARRFFLNRWFWFGVGLALLICLPNLVWQVRHNFISYHFLHHIHERDIRLARANGFLIKQFFVCTNFYAVPLWIAGLNSFLRIPRYRLIAWMYLIPLLLFFLRTDFITTWAPRIPCLSPWERSWVKAGAGRCRVFGGMWCELFSSPGSPEPDFTHVCLFFRWPPAVRSCILLYGTMTLSAKKLGGLIWSRTSPPFATLYLRHSRMLASWSGTTASKVPSSYSVRPITCPHP